MKESRPGDTGTGLPAACAQWGGRVHQAVQAVVAAMVLAGVTGCASSRAYFIDRGRDAADVLTISVGAGLGARARIGPIETGAFLGSDKAGLRGGEIGAYTWEEFGMMSAAAGDALVLSFEEYNPDLGADTTAEQRGKFYSAEGVCLVSLLEDGDRRSWRVHPYYTQVEAQVGVLGSLRLGVNPGELVDFIFGWCGLDIFRDDVEARKRQEQSSTPAQAAGVPAPGL
jgi:hypothetical protein